MKSIGVKMRAVAHAIVLLNIALMVIAQNDKITEVAILSFGFNVVNMLVQIIIEARKGIAQK